MQQRKPGDAVIHGWCLNPLWMEGIYSGPQFFKVLFEALDFWVKFRFGFRLGFSL